MRSIPSILFVAIMGQTIFCHGQNTERHVLGNGNEIIICPYVPSGEGQMMTTLPNLVGEIHEAKANIDEVTKLVNLVPSDTVVLGVELGYSEVYWIRKARIGNALYQSPYIDYLCRILSKIRKEVILIPLDYEKSTGATALFLKDWLEANRHNPALSDHLVSLNKILDTITISDDYSGGYPYVIYPKIVYQTVQKIIDEIKANEETIKRDGIVRYDDFKNAKQSLDFQREVVKKNDIGRLQYRDSLFSHEILLQKEDYPTFYLLGMDHISFTPKYRGKIADNNTKTILDKNKKTCNYFILLSEKKLSRPFINRFPKLSTYIKRNKTEKYIKYEITKQGSKSIYYFINMLE